MDEKELTIKLQQIDSKDEKLKSNEQKTRELPPVRGTKKAHENEKMDEKIALEYKTKGNESYKKKDYQKALEFYDRSLQIKKDVNVYNNKAAVYIQLKKYKEAEFECTNAIFLDSENGKAYLRRANARLEQRKASTALSDSKLAVKLLPDSKEAKIVLEKSKKLNESLNSNSSPVLSSNKKENRNSKFDFLSKSNPLVTSPRVKIKNQTNNVVFEEISSEEIVEEKEIKQVKDEKIKISKIETKMPKKAPSTFFEFEQYFREFKGTNKFEEYFKLIEPKNFAKLFGSSFTVDHLNEILNCILNTYLKSGTKELEDFSVEILKNLTKISRFDQTIMFLDEREVLDEILKKLKGKIPKKIELIFE
eukprot:gene11920-5325_t